jgi:hypothetical protein
MGRVIPIFLAMGIGWAVQITGFLRTGAFVHDAAIAPAVYVLVPLAAVIVGACALWLHRRAVFLPEVPIAAVIVAAGLFAGISVGFVWWPPDGVTCGAQTGLVLGAALLPILLPTLRAMAKVDQPGKWALAGLAVAVTAPLTLPRWNPYPTAHGSGSGVGLVVGGLGAVVALVAHTAIVRAPAQSLPAGSPYRTATLDLPRVPNFARLALGCAAVAVLAVLAAVGLW